MLIPVIFLKPQTLSTGGSYNAGERAGFPQRIAADLVNAGNAVYVVKAKENQQDTVSPETGVKESSPEDSKTPVSRKPKRRVSRKLVTK